MTRRQTVADDETVDRIVDRAALYQLTPEEAAALRSGVGRLRRQRGAASTRSRRAAAKESPAAAAVRALHEPYRSVSDDAGDSCAHCNRLAGYPVPWPCPTIAALDSGRR